MVSRATSFAPTLLYDRQLVQRLLEDGAQVVEVLAPSAYRQAHLPGAVNLPLWKMTPEALRQLDRERPVIVYCNDFL